MKTIKNQIVLNIQKMFNYGILDIPIMTALIILFLSSCSSTAPAAQQTEEGVNVTPPSWAPYYDNVNLVQYYYLPDIECYYDVWNHEFVYLDNGNWMFAASLPPAYSWYDLDNCFSVVLDYHVHQPWMHYQFYVANYPRFYYRTVYKTTYNRVDHPVRGFNENARTVVYNNTNVKQVHEQIRQPDNTARTVESTHPAQRMEYYGKTIGQPVKVQKQMMRPRQMNVQRQTVRPQQTMRPQQQIRSQQTGVRGK